MNRPGNEEYDYKDDYYVVPICEIDEHVPKDETLWYTYEISFVYDNGSWIIDDVMSLNSIELITIQSHSNPVIRLYKDKVASVRLYLQKYDYQLAKKIAQDALYKKLAEMEML